MSESTFHHVRAVAYLSSLRLIPGLPPGVPALIRNPLHFFFRDGGSNIKIIAELQLVISILIVAVLLFGPGHNDVLHRETRENAKLSHSMLHIYGYDFSIYFVIEALGYMYFGLGLLKLFLETLAYFMPRYLADGRLKVERKVD